MAGKTMHNCENCDYKSNRRWAVNRHSSKMHQNIISPQAYVTKGECINFESSLQQPSVPSQLPSQHHQPLPYINAQSFVSQSVNAGAGQKELYQEQYNDEEDTLSEVSSDKRRPDFFDSDSESDSESEPGDLENTIDEMQEKLDEIITLRKQFRAKLPEILGVDIKKRKRLLKKISAYTIKGMDQTVGIDPDEDSDEDESDNEDSNEDEEEDAGEESLGLESDNFFNLAEDVKLQFQGDEEAEEELEDEMQKAIKKCKDEKKNQIEEEDSSDESDSECGATEKGLKQDEKDLHQCIYGVECEGCEYFEHCSNEKIETIYRWCEHVLNNGEQYDVKNAQKVKIKWMPIRFHVRALADPEQPLHAKRKILQKATVGEGVMSGLATLVLPMMRRFLRTARDRD